MCQSHASNVVYVNLLNEIEATQVRKVDAFVLLLDQNLHTPCINNIALELLLERGYLFFEDFFDFCFKLACYMVFLADFYLKVKFFLVLGTTHRLYLRESRTDVLPQILSVFTASVNQHNM
jgi:hypothetical protein